MVLVLSTMQDSVSKNNGLGIYVSMMIVFLGYLRAELVACPGGAISYLPPACKACRRGRQLLGQRVAQRQEPPLPRRQVPGVAK